MSLKKIGELRLGLYAHRRYLNRFGTPESIEVLLGAHLIGFDHDDHSAKALAKGILPITRDLFKFRCDHDAAQMAAINAGIGIGVMQTALARRNPDLVSVLCDEISFKLDVWLVVHEDQRDQLAIRVVFDALAEQLRAFIGLQPT